MAQTLKFGKGTWATKTGSSMAYNDQNGNYKPLPFNVERDSIATRVNKEGLIEVVGKDKLRIDYTDSAKGVALLENSSTNLFTYSEDFSQSSWNKASSTVTLTSELSPNGTTDSVYNLTGTSANLYVGGTTGVQHTISFYIKSNGQGKDKFKLRLGNNTSIEYTATNQWVRYEYTETPTTSVFGITTTSAPNNEFDLLIWGAQSEQNSFATSYIPTSGSTVQRQADVVNGSGNSEVFNDSEGVLFADIAALADDLTNRAITISDKTSNNRIFITYYAESNGLFSQIISNGVIQATLTAKLPSIKNSTKVLVKYKQNDFQLWVNGFEVSSDEIGVTPIGLDDFSFDRGTGTLNFYGKTKELAYYDATLTDSELEYLTSYRSLNELVTELNLNTL